MLSVSVFNKLVIYTVLYRYSLASRILYKFNSIFAIAISNLFYILLNKIFKLMKFKQIYK